MNAKDEINSLKRKLLDLDKTAAPIDKKQKIRYGDKEYKKGKSKKSEQEILDKLNQFSTRIKSNQLATHQFISKDE